VCVLEGLVCGGDDELLPHYRQEAHRSVKTHGVMLKNMDVIFLFPVSLSGYLVAFHTPAAVIVRGH
jgi:hypothetical protein